MSPQRHNPRILDYLSPTVRQPRPRRDQPDPTALPPERDARCVLGGIVVALSFAYIIAFVISHLHTP